MRLLGALFLPPALAFAITYSVTSALDVPQPKPERATSIVWGGRVFETRGDFAQWLRARGGNYRAWARRHPGILGRQTSAGRTASRSGVVAAAARSPDSKILALGGAAAVLFVGLLVFISRSVRAPKLVFTPFGGRAPPSVPSALRRPRRRLLVSPISLSSARQVAVASCASSKRAVARSIHGAHTLARNQNRRRHRLGTPRISLRLRPTFGRPRIEMPMAQLAQVSTTSKRLLLRAGGAARGSSERVVRASRVGVALRWYLTGLILTTALCMFIAARN
jgi:hypothetical protein